MRCKEADGQYGALQGAAVDRITDLIANRRVEGRAMAPRIRTWVVGAVLVVFAQGAHAQRACEASDHGMRADGSDNVPALTRTLSECAGQTIHIAHGTYMLSPLRFASGLIVPAGTTIVGDGSQGAQATILKIADSGNFQALFWIRNVSKVAIRSIRFEGTPYESGCTRHLDYGHAIYVQSDKGQGAGVDNVEVSDNFFHDFNGQSWVTINAADDSPGIGLNGPLSVSNNVFDSDANLSGGCAATGGMTYLAAMISIHGSNTSAQGMAENVTVASNTLNAGYVKEGMTIWSGTKNITVKSNVVADTGLQLPRTQGPELGRYAILVYHSAHELPGLQPDTISIVGNTITNPVSCGIYAAGGQNLQILDNRISGQTDTYDVTLPKGAISLNHANVVALRGNVLINNHFGISAVGGQRNLGANQITASPGGVATKIR
jgi:hypothetical protein